jgi:hypothetical protein
VGREADRCLELVSHSGDRGLFAFNFFVVFSWKYFPLLSIQQNEKAIYFQKAKRSKLFHLTYNAVRLLGGAPKHFPRKNTKSISKK